MSCLCITDLCIIFHGKRIFLKRFFIFIVLLSQFLYGSIYDKSAIVYYGDDISYPTVGLHDYIIVQPEHINTDLHGFKLYKDKMYAYVSIGEIDKTIKEYKDIDKSWIVAQNKAWSSDVLDIKNVNYLKFLFKEMIEPRFKQGFKNFFFDTLDSYQLYSKTPQERKNNEEALAIFINEFHHRYPDAKLIINRGFEIIDKIHNSINAVLFESYYKGIGGKKLAYQNVSDDDRKWLDTHLDKIKSYGLDVISVEYMDEKSLYTQKADHIINKIKRKGMIPYISNRDLDIYGKSSKTAVKREIFTLIDESSLDRTVLEAHQYGAVVLEYLGYKQKLYDINKGGLPDIKYLRHYKGVLIWLRNYTKHEAAFIAWLQKLKDNNIKVVFMSNFGLDIYSDKMSFLGLTFDKMSKGMRKKRVLHKDSMVGYEIAPPMYNSDRLVSLKKGKKLLTFEYNNKKTSTPAAITPWGAYMVGDAYITEIDGKNLWIVNPFKFFIKALRLEKLPVADVTTENGKRVFFTHVDGDGLANRVEGDFGKYSGDVILNKILKVYKIPHSISIIGSDVDRNGPFGKLYDELLPIVEAIYAQNNVEGATHTYTHTFFWGKIKHDNLDPRYRLKVKGYRYSLFNELVKPLRVINSQYYPEGKTPPAHTVFWSGDCAPRVNALSILYRYKLLAINGGDTTIMQTAPWLSGIAPLGLQRDGYTQIYTGAQNENVFTNDWLGPFWGFKRVTQTFKLTNSPRRFKPIDIYYHLYSGSKQASLEALKYVFDWALKQDIIPMYTSRYIPKVMDFYEYSLASDDKKTWVFYGLESLNTIRIEEKNSGVDLDKSKTVVGIKHFQTHTYLSLSHAKKHIITLDKKKYKEHSYMVSSNGLLLNYERDDKTHTYNFDAYIPLKMEFHIARGCSVTTNPKADMVTKNGESRYFSYKTNKHAEVKITCLENF